jgi:RHH-type transcriptional regulator, proline utilization regulon repressor / proline dehydrogenase / delta 1-pyrroline-5-carboxylate dehydrogenase
VRQAMKILGDNFVLGRTIKEALSHAAPLEAKGYRFSYDMLGEGAKSRRDAERYYDRYHAAIEAVGQERPLDASHTLAMSSRPSISVKLSAIHPRYEPGKEERLAFELLPRVLELARAARYWGLGLTIDAEEQDRLDLMLDVFAATFIHPAIEG